MFRLTREVRFAINASADEQSAKKPTNGFSGFPTLVGLGQYLSLRATLEGELNPESQYLRNIKDIDDVIREQAIAIVRRAIQNKTSAAFLIQNLLAVLKDKWPGSSLEKIELLLSPFLAVSCLLREYPMVRLSQKFEFSASHRLHNSAITEAQNWQTFGKCNNPHGHGHNYEVQVNLVGEPDANGLLVNMVEFERLVGEAVIDRLDHRYLNVEVEAFKDLIPTVENIAMVIFGWLKSRFSSGQARLASVVVWETGKTSCEYSE